MTILMGGDLQATPENMNKRSYFPALHHFCETIGLTQVTPEDTYTFISTNSHIDHWLLRQPTTAQRNMPHNTIITTHTPKYGEHKALKLQLPKIGDIRHYNA